MPIHTHIVLAGTILAIPLAPFVQCGDVDTGGDGELTELGGDEELTVLDGDEEPTLLGEDEESRFFPGLFSVGKLEELGKRVFFDKISRPKNRMGCATCHDPTTGWTFPDEETNLGQVAATGADPTTVGTLKTPTSAYASFVPKFQECPAGLALFCGGLFWDGRAEGNEPPEFPDGATDHVGDEVFEFKKGNFKGFFLKYLYKDFLGPLADQALNPFPNPVEQNISIRDVCKHVAKSEYAHIYKSAWGEAIDCSDNLYGSSKKFKAYVVSYRRIATALAAYQSSYEVNSFSSKRDKALRRELWGIDKDSSPGKFPLKGLTAQENLGHELFYNTLPNPFAPPGVPLDEAGEVLNVPPNSELPVTNCSFCHRSSQELIDGTDPQERYTDDAYHNIGVPKNHEIPESSTNPGKGLLAAHTGRVGTPDDTGLVRTPTLRNIDKRPNKYFVKAYMHNGWFKSLESVVHFYNTANVDLPPELKKHDVTRCPEGITTEEEALAQNCWPAPEFQATAANVTPLLGNLGLSADHEAAIVAYMKTFTDTKTVKPPKQHKPHKWGHDH